MIPAYCLAYLVHISKKNHISLLAISLKRARAFEKYTYLQPQDKKISLCCHRTMQDKTLPKANVEDERKTTLCFITTSSLSSQLL